jgi:very-short-patch-repair endonuclease
LEQQGWEVVRIPNCRIQTSLAQVGNEIVDHVTMRERSNE